MKKVVWVLILAITVILSGCQSTPEPQIKLAQGAFLRVINLTETTYAPLLDGQVFGGDLAPQGVTIFIKRPKGERVLQLDPNDPTTQVKLPVDEGDMATFAIRKDGEGFSVTKITGEQRKPETGKGGFTVVNLTRQPLTITPAGGPEAKVEPNKTSALLPLSDAGSIEANIAAGALTVKATNEGPVNSGYTVFVLEERGKLVAQVTQNYAPMQVNSEANAGAN